MKNKKITASGQQVSSRRFMVIVLADLLAAALLGLSLFPRPAGRLFRRVIYGSPRNVILIILDAAQADHFSSYGYKKNTTPRMDEISRQGTIFLNNFTPATETYNSMPLIFSSRYFSKEIFQKDAWEWGVRRESSDDLFREFDPEQILLPRLLAVNSYRTAIVHNHPWFVPETALVKSFEKHFQISVPLLERPADKEIIDRALSWIKKNRDRPFFVYLHIMSPHQPYPPKPEDREFMGGVSAMDAVRRKFAAKRDETARGWTPDELKTLNDLYDSNLCHSDTQVGRLYDKLKEWGLARDTLFIITSDHGENLGRHNALNHGGPPWDSVTHAPLIMVFPGRIPAGVRVRGLAESIDIMPTIANLCKLNIPAGKSLDGVDLTKFITRPESGREAVYTDGSIRTPGYKCFLDEDGYALFDLTRDPGEEDNVVGRYQKMVTGLSEKYKLTMKPYLARFEGARQTGPPPYPFYLPLRDFSLTPESSCRICHDGKPPRRVLKDIDPAGPWLFNKESHQGGLFCLPGKGPPPPVTLSIPMPNGVYRVSILVELLGPADEHSRDPGLRFRFNSGEEFRGEIGRSPAPCRECFYIEGGRVRVEENRFSLELSVLSDSKTDFFLRHVRFYPDHLPGGPAAADEKIIRKRKEGLRSLGYLK